MKAKEVMTSDFIKADIKDTVSSVLGKLKKSKQDTALLFKGDKFIGLFSKHRLIKSRLDPKTSKAGHFIKHVPVLNGEEELIETARLIYTSNMPVIPVVHEQKVIGAVKAIDVVDKLDAGIKEQRIDSVATMDLFTINENDETATAMSIMYNKTIDRLPVVDKNGNLLNIVTLHDLITSFMLMQQTKTEARGRKGATVKGSRTVRAYRKRVDIRALPIRNFTSPVVITADANEDVGTVINDLKEYSISSIILVKGKKAVGIVTIRDLLGLFLKDFITK